MNSIYIAACSLDGRVVRLVTLAAPSLEEARAVLHRLGELPLDAVVTFVPVPTEVAAAVGLVDGGGAEWWLGEKLGSENDKSDTQDSHAPAGFRLH